jgi:hypothetical protein
MTTNDALSHAEAMDLMSIQRLSYRATALKDHLNNTNGKFGSKEEMLASLDRNSFAKHKAEWKDGDLNTGGDGVAEAAEAWLLHLFALSVEAAKAWISHVFAPLADQQERYDFSDIDEQALEHLTKRFPDLRAPLRDTTFSQFGVVVSEQQKTCFVVFRGTVRSREWLTDGDRKFVSLAEKTSCIADISGVHSDVRVHAGFAESLFSKWREGLDGENLIDSAYNRIVDVRTTRSR